MTQLVCMHISLMCLFLATLACTATVGSLISTHDTAAKPTVATTSYFSLMETALTLSLKGWLHEAI